MVFGGIRECPSAPGGRITLEGGPGRNRRANSNGENGFIPVLALAGLSSSGSASLYDVELFYHPISEPFVMYGTKIGDVPP